MSTINVKPGSPNHFPTVEAVEQVRQPGGRITVTGSDGNVYECFAPADFANGKIVPMHEYEEFAGVGHRAMPIS